MSPTNFILLSLIWMFFFGTIFRILVQKIRDDREADARLTGKDDRDSERGGSRDW
ncbi:hypothetical protein IFT84_17605 [Rhizobium sp. CFBP 8762]|uniref:hypothetical protein n=1 Tax=Rhizobium sp. CFBP 8762 TaxID=2775279 RepID=UPI001783FE28|nr:hypothetical protein [Rhizobium sp. CFBP 8762]MBD8556327.1 hypothetical protein [Rhizobium sp. CFBP 8762]